jgi:hypothetical protein
MARNSFDVREDATNDGPPGAAPGFLVSYSGGEFGHLEKNEQTSEIL